MMQKLMKYKNATTLTVSILLTLLLIYSMVFLGGNTNTQRMEDSASVHLVQQFDDFMSRKTAASMGQEETALAYTLSDTDPVAPEPNQENFGQVETPQEMAPILEAAETLLDGQSMYFSTETVLMPNHPVRYYLDDSIFTVTWKEDHENIAFTFSEVKIKDPSQFRRFLSGGKYASGINTLCSEMAASVNAVVATNGDYYAYQKSGNSVYNGKAYRYDDLGGLQTCYIDDKGDMIFTYDGETNSLEEVQKFVDENNIRFSMCFGPIMVDNGELLPVRNYRLGEVNGIFSRAAICQMDELHYLMVTANYEDRLFYLPDMTQFARILHGTGCQKAYALDGGQSATLVMNDEVINHVSYGDERKQSDIIYFATAIPQED